MKGGTTRRESNSHWFNLFNAVASQAMMGTPIILLANSLEASALFLGIVTALSPLGTILQLPTARFLHASEYRTTLLVGWFLRTVFIIPVALLPLASFLDQEAKLVLLLLLLVTFNVLRGISTAAWWPWIAELIPEDRRGRFLARDQLFTYAGGMCALAAYGWVMSRQADGTAFTQAFLIGAGCGLLSLGFLARMPKPSPARKALRPGEAVGWRAAFSERRFFKLIGLNVALMLVVGSLNVFAVQFLRDVQGFSPESILYLSAIMFLGPLASLSLLGKWTDHRGPEPVLVGVFAAYGCVTSGWLLIALGILPCAFLLVGLLQIFGGIASAVFNVANIHLVLKVIPEIGRNRFLAMFTVITSLALGAAPVFFGWFLDSVGDRTFSLNGEIFGRHAIYFAILCALSAGGLIAASCWLIKRPLRTAE